MKTKLIFILPLLLIISCQKKQNEKSKESAAGKYPKIELTSPSFADRGMIPSNHSYDGGNVSPQLLWSKGPEGTKSYAVICDDPDAPMGTWVHWVIYNIPSGRLALDAKLPQIGNLRDGMMQGVNDFGETGYSGPRPPGGIHRYFFKIYALDTLFKTRSGMSKRELENSMKGHVLAYGELVGKFLKE